MSEVVQKTSSQDGTVKVLWKLHDGQTIESVILPRALKQRKKLSLWSASKQLLHVNEQMESPRSTACISSQVGCAMACDFCLTGKQGFTRHLSSQEIIDQVLGLHQITPITNLVFMGMGEPLHNVGNVVSAIQFLMSPSGLKLSRRKITVSTSGLVDALPALAKTGVKLAISLNATDDELRSRLMPVNRKHAIHALITAAKQYALAVRQAVMIEYILLKDLNDTPEDAARLIALCEGWDCKVNLIPYNPFEGSLFQRPEPEPVKAFQHSLVSKGVTATVRYSGGDDIYAACGQLKSLNAIRKRI